MNILILTGRFGMGHIKVAEVLRREMENSSVSNYAAAAPDVHVTTVDFLSYLFPHISGVIYSGFGLVVSHFSGLYNSLNKAAGHYGGVPLKRTLAGKIDRLIRSTDADLIISVLPICGQYISAYKELTGCAVPLYTYVTDVTVHEEWLATETDRYFVGDLCTANALRSKGVPPQKITVTGIPVSPDFRQAAVQQESSLNCEPSAQADKKRVLIMGGGLGLLPGSNQLLPMINDNPQIEATLIAGKNEKLARESRERYPNIRVIGFTDEVARYMREADLVITKPGGITTFEAIASRTPLYVIEPFLEQEKGNAQYIESANIGRVLWNGVGVEEDLRCLLQNDFLLKNMQENMARLEAEFAPTNPLFYFDHEEMRLCS